MYYRNRYLYKTAGYGTNLINHGMDYIRGTAIKYMPEITAVGHGVNFNSGLRTSLQTTGVGHSVAGAINSVSPVMNMLTGPTSGTTMAESAILNSIGLGLTRAGRKLVNKSGKTRKKYVELIDSATRAGEAIYGKTPTKDDAHRVFGGAVQHTAKRNMKADVAGIARNIIERRKAEISDVKKRLGMK